MDNWKEIIDILIPYRYWIVGMGVWLFFGWAGFVTWVFDAYINKVRVRFIEWVKLLFFMLIAGFIGWIISFRSIKNYLIRIT